MADIPRQLWAKSLSGDPAKRKQEVGSASYRGHIHQVMISTDVLLKEMGEQILQQLGLLQSVSIEEFVQATQLAAYLHDWGKANQHFQEMVRLKSLNQALKILKESGQAPSVKELQLQKLQKQLSRSSQLRGYRQMIRHEVISGILALQVEVYRAWLREKYSHETLMIAVWAAMGHHLKAGLGRNQQLQGEITYIPTGTGDELRIYTQHPDFRAILAMGQKTLGLPKMLPQHDQEVWSKQELLQAMDDLLDEFTEFEQDLSEEKQRLIAAVKATVIAADLAGSALPKEDGETFEDFKEWMQEVLQLTLLPESMEDLLRERLGGKCLYPFQEQVAGSPHRVTWLSAGCGGGKTVAAYAWAKEKALGRKLFFCYPTTGTASQGFIDYVHETKIDGIEAALMHSRADLDRELLFSGDSDPLEADAEKVDARLSAFQAWRNRLIVCTVDTVLGLIQNNRKPLYAWPAVANAAFVFDEVHAYDKRLFGALLKFLRTFRGAPVLLMSASFTTQQRQKIQEVLTELGEEISEEPIPGRADLEALARYDIEWFPEISESKGATEIWQPVIKTLQHHGKVLWVTNSVQSCIELYREAQEKLGQQLPHLKPLIYHSRYRYKDRLEKHNAVIEAFKEDESKGVLAITTQVCEMSLDINADLLISALAPASAVIQRLGRLNRRMESSDEGSRLALIYNWQDQYPYAEEEQQTGYQLMQRTAGSRGVSQTDLATILGELNAREESEVYSCWLEGNWATYPDSLRESGGTVTVLLQEDINQIRQATEERQKIDKDWSFMREAQAWSVPIRIPQPSTKLREWRRCRFYPIAPSDEIIYSEETGAEPCNS
jgi:CRISPR-associated endonuclease/helicase Cas3